MDIRDRVDEMNQSKLQAKIPDKMEFDWLTVDYLFFSVQYSRYKES